MWRDVLNCAHSQKFQVMPANLAWMLTQNSQVCKSQQHPGFVGCHWYAVYSIDEDKSFYPNVQGYRNSLSVFLQELFFSRTNASLWWKDISSWVDTAKIKTNSPKVCPCFQVRKEHKCIVLLSCELFYLIST